MCGEKHEPARAESLIMGSPPRVRGKEGLNPLLMCSMGITPACAGKRRGALYKRQKGEDHPRVCGEKCIRSAVPMGHLGSPPRVRGKVDAATLTLKARGITPACAGKRKSYSKHKKHHRDHPRVCGEKIISRFVLRLCEGSPPRVRGKEALDIATDDERRITPACAGKRRPGGVGFRRVGDHPRVCGEKDQTKYQLTRGQGSPPRVRGKVLYLGCHPTKYKDHPRVCGEKW